MTMTEAIPSRHRRAWAEPLEAIATQVDAVRIDCEFGDIEAPDVGEALRQARAVVDHLAALDRMHTEDSANRIE